MKVIQNKGKSWQTFGRSQRASKECDKLICSITAQNIMKHVHKFSHVGQMLSDQLHDNQHINSVYESLSFTCFTGLHHLRSCISCYFRCFFRSASAGADATHDAEVDLPCVESVKAHTDAIDYLAIVSAMHSDYICFQFWFLIISAHLLPCIVC